MADPELAERIEAVRRFNRFYTRRIGALQEGLLDSPFSLTEVRVLYELAHRDAPTASALAADLGIDGGYLSRILRRFRKAGFVAKKASDRDARQSLLTLTRAGHRALAPLAKRSSDEVGAMLGTLPPDRQRRLLDAMATIQSLLEETAPRARGYLLRAHRPGDLGWVIHRHAALYAEEYGWDETFEALVADIAAKFIREFDPKRESCWIAEQDGAIVGAVCLVRASDTDAKLRLLYVEPAARGLGIGRRLVDECIRFARRTGYTRLTLWTNKNLDAARRIYETAGFTLIEEAPHRSFGHDLVGQTWSLEL